LLDSLGRLGRMVDQLVRGRFQADVCPVESSAGRTPCEVLWCGQRSSRCTRGRTGKKTGRCEREADARVSRNSRPGGTNPRRRRGALEQSSGRREMFWSQRYFLFLILDRDKRTVGHITYLR
jgi:hypothetical protein